MIQYTGNHSLDTRTGFSLYRGILLDHAVQGAKRE